MPGSGKSTLGKLLANEIGYPFHDLDDVIVEAEGKAIKEIFEEQGEDYFRQTEAKHLRKVMTQNDQFILACGGGTPCYHDNMQFIKEEGCSIYLKVSVNTLFARLDNTIGGSRPLVGKQGKELKEFLIQQLVVRSEFYGKADYTWEEADSLDDLVRDLGLFS